MSKTAGTWVVGLWRTHRVRWGRLTWLRRRATRPRRSAQSPSSTVSCCWSVWTTRCRTTPHCWPALRPNRSWRHPTCRPLPSRTPRSCLSCNPVDRKRTKRSWKETTGSTPSYVVFFLQKSHTPTAYTNSRTLFADAVCAFSHRRKTCEPTSSWWCLAGKCQEAHKSHNTPKTGRYKKQADTTPAHTFV